MAFLVKHKIIVRKGGRYTKLLLIPTENWDKAYEIVLEAAKLVYPNVAMAKSLTTSGFIYTADNDHSIIVGTLFREPLQELGNPAFNLSSEEYKQHLQDLFSP